MPPIPTDSFIPTTNSSVGISTLIAVIWKNYPDVGTEDADTELLYASRFIPDRDILGRWGPLQMRSCFVE